MGQGNWFGFIATELLKHMCFHEKKSKQYRDLKLDMCGHNRTRVVVADLS